MLQRNFKLSCDSRFQRAFTACSCVFKVITLVCANQDNYYENATACSKRTLKTTVATQLYRHSTSSTTTDLGNNFTSKNTSKILSKNFNQYKVTCLTSRTFCRCLNRVNFSNDSKLKLLPPNVPVAITECVTDSD